MNSPSDNMPRYNGGLGSVLESDCGSPGAPADSWSSWGQDSESRLLVDTAEMNRIVVTRPSCIEPAIANKPVVLLTGAWPDGQSKGIVELDVAIDHRFTRLDQEAERLAELAGSKNPYGQDLPAPWVNVLALRYYLLRLLRVIEFFSQIQPPRKGETLQLLADKADREDVAIIAALCRRMEAKCSVQWRGEEAESSPPAAAEEEGWRRTLRRLRSYLPNKDDDLSRGRRVVLCGNPRFLDPLCHVLLQRKCHVWWLYDRFAVKPFMLWYAKGVEQLTCQDDLPLPNEPDDQITLPKLEYGGVNVGPLVADWLAKRLASRKQDQRRWQNHIERHFHRIKPDYLVMDEDATPLKRIALAVARRHGGKSYVIQHGAPVARFGFAPLAADGLFAWGRSSREQFQRWDIPSEKIHITGSPAHDQLYQALHRKSGKRARTDKPPRILLLATVPPKDDRPDLIEMNMNSRTYGEMIEAAFAALELVPGATLVIKPHPRSQKDHVVQDAASRHPKLRVEHSKAKSLPDALRSIDCVLSCLSSAGIEATLAGLPVIQLVPRGAGKILPHDRWGLAGSAATAQQLLPLIQKVLVKRGRSKMSSLGDVFANASFWGRNTKNVPDSATRIVDFVLDQQQTKQTSRESRNNQGQGSSVAAVRR